VARESARARERVATPTMRVLLVLALLLGPIGVATASSSSSRPTPPPRERGGPAREWRRAVERMRALDYHALRERFGGGVVEAGADGDRHGAPCAFRDAATRASFDLSPLKLPYGSSYMFHDVQGAEDSVHARARERERGRLPREDESDAEEKRDEGDDDDDDNDADAEAKDEYDYWINVCQAVSSPPRECAGKPGAPAYQVVVHPGDGDGDGGGGDDDDDDGGGGGTRAKRDKRNRRRRGRRRRGDTLLHDVVDEDFGRKPKTKKHKKKPAECHALGSLRNVTFALIDAASPETGVRCVLSYTGPHTTALAR